MHVGWSGAPSSTLVGSQPLHVRLALVHFRLAALPRSGPARRFRRDTSATCISWSLPPPVNRTASGGIDTAGTFFFTSAACRSPPPRQSTRSTAPTGGASSRRSSAWWATSTWRKRRPRRHLPPPSTSGATAGVPEFPRAWIIQTARHKAIDRIRRRARYAEKLEAYAASPLHRVLDEPEYLHRRHSRRSAAPDLHVLSPGARARGAGGADAAHAVRPRDRRDRARVPRAGGDDGAAARPREAQDPRRRHSVRGFQAPTSSTSGSTPCSTVIYLVFNEGYAATRGESLVRADLCAEAIRLGRLVRELTAPRTPAEATGLLALMLLHDAGATRGSTSAAISCCSTIRTAAAGTRRRFRGAAARR